MKVNRLVPLALSVFLSLMSVSPNVVFADSGSQVEQILANEGAEASFETLGEQEFLMSTSLDAEDGGSMLAEAGTYYEVLVKGQKITSENKDDVLGDGGSVKYEPASAGQRAKLILNGATIDDDTSHIPTNWLHYGAIEVQEELDIILYGDNIINIESFDSGYTNSLKRLFGIFGKENIYFSGGGTLSIYVNSEEAPDNLEYTSGISCPYGVVCSFNGVRINISLYGYTQQALGIMNCCDISNCDIDVNCNVAYNEKIVAPSHPDRAVTCIANEEEDRAFNIKSSNLDLNIEPRVGLTGDKSYLDGIKNLSKEINISGDTSIITRGTRISIYTSGLNIKDRYKIDLGGTVQLFDSDKLGINFENITPGAYFTAGDGYKNGILVCTDSVAEGRAKFKAPSQAIVLAGSSEKTAIPVAREELGKLIYYVSNTSAPNNVTFIKLGYNCNISFNGGGGLGTVYDVQAIEGSKYTLPNCEFTAPSGMRFKAWSVGGIEYAPGTRLVIGGNTVITALWENESSGVSSVGGTSVGVSSGGGSSGGVSSVGGTSVGVSSGGGTSVGGTSVGVSSGGGTSGGSSSVGSSRGGGSSGGGSSKSGATGLSKQSGVWIQDATGWWYRNADGSYPRGSWQQIGSTWYAFNAAGYMITGWYSSDGSWYYLNTSGAMSTGWEQINGYWYYFNASGAMSTGWVQLNGKWYYMEQVGSLQPQGSMYVSNYTPDGYFVDADGVCIDQ